MTKSGDVLGSMFAFSLCMVAGLVIDSDSDTVLGTAFVVGVLLAAYVYGD
jgi:hypothetical protein